MELTKREKTCIAVIVVLAIAVITMSVFLGIHTYDRFKYKTSVENVYRHAYYALMENYLDIETSLDKVKVTRGSSMLEEELGNIIENSGLASLALSTLNTENNELTSIYKFTNQVGDYSRFIIKKIGKGESVTEGERATLDKMHDITRKISSALGGIEENVNKDGYSFVDSLGKREDAFSIAIRDLNNGSVEYPALIYDGPFSDAIHDIKPKNLKGDKITKEDGENKIKTMFEDVVSVNFIGENTNKFTSFLYDIRLGDGTMSTVQLSEIGGHILMFSSFRENGEDAINREDAINTAKTFLEHNGYSDMRDVYVSLSRGAYYINFAPCVDGIIYYPDLIKVKVASDTGKVIGMEAMNYIYNHVDRELDKVGVLGESEVIKDIPSDMEIETVRLALIPKGIEKEILCYEVIGTLGEDKYYIYLDAKTREEVNVLMEIKSSGGNLLI